MLPNSIKVAVPVWPELFNSPRAMVNTSPVPGWYAEETDGKISNKAAKNIKLPPVNDLGITTAPLTELRYYPRANRFHCPVRPG